MSFSVPLSRQFIGACVATLALFLTGNAFAANTSSSKFEPTGTVQGTTLLLNGAGTRHKFFFKVYDLALYTKSNVSTPEELLALPGPKRLNFVALRELAGTDIGKSFIKGLSANSSPEMVTRYNSSNSRLIEIFAGRPKLMPGDSFAMEFVPGKGTTFFIVGQPQGAPVGDDEFFNMVLKIWVGDDPADSGLKDALLGSK